MGRDRTGFLGRMAELSIERVARARQDLPDSAVRTRAIAQTGASLLRLEPDGFDVIAEVKLRSPSEGPLTGVDADARARVGSQAREYAQAGAAAISVLTEPDEFSGDLEHVAWATQSTTTPVMRKDFLVDEYQVHEARAAGASGVLLIVRILETAEVTALARAARALGMFVLIESFDEHDIARATEAWETLQSGLPEEGGAPLVLLGVNCRDLSSLQVDFERLERMAPKLPAEAVTVAESGLATASDARAAAAAGYRMALVGSALMKAPDPSKLLTAMTVAGREEVGCASA